MPTNDETSEDQVTLLGVALLLAAGMVAGLTARRYGGTWGWRVLVESVLSAGGVFLVALA